MSACPAGGPRTSTMPQAIDHATGRARARRRSPRRLGRVHPGARRRQPGRVRVAASPLARWPRAATAGDPRGACAPGHGGPRLPGRVATGFSHRLRTVAGDGGAVRLSVRREQGPTARRAWDTRSTSIAGIGRRRTAQVAAMVLERCSRVERLDQVGGGDHAVSGELVVQVVGRSRSWSCGSSLELPSMPEGVRNSVRGASERFLAKGPDLNSRELRTTAARPAGRNTGRPTRAGIAPRPRVTRPLVPAQAGSEVLLRLSRLLPAGQVRRPRGLRPSGECSPRTDDRVVVGGDSAPGSCRWPPVGGVAAGPAGRPGIPSSRSGGRAQTSVLDVRPTGAAAWGPDRFGGAPASPSSQPQGRVPTAPGRSSENWPLSGAVVV